MPYKHCLTMPQEPAALFRAMEYAAKMDTLQLGADRDTLLREYGVCWMIARAYLHMDAWPEPGTPITVSTCHRGVVRGVCYRDYEILVEGAPVGEAVQLWVTVDVNKRTICRADRIPVLNQGFGTGTRRPERLQPPILEMAPSQMADRHDENGHINNVDYVRMGLRALNLPLTAFHTVELEYHRECFAHTQLPCMRSEEPGLSFVRLFTPQGPVAFDMRLTV